MKTMKNLLLALALIAVVPVVAVEPTVEAQPSRLRKTGSFALNLGKDTICSPWTVAKELFGQVKKGYNAYAPSRQTVGHVAKRAAQLSAVALLVILTNKGINCALNTGVTERDEFKNVLFGDNAQKAVAAVSGVASSLITTHVPDGVHALGQWLMAPHFRNAQ